MLKLFVFSGAALSAMIIVGLSKYQARLKLKGRKPGQTDNLESGQVDVIKSTWNLLNH